MFTLKKRSDISRSETRPMLVVRVDWAEESVNDETIDLDLNRSGNFWLFLLSYREFFERIGRFTRVLNFRESIYAYVHIYNVDIQYIYCIICVYNDFGVGLDKIETFLSAKNI